MFLVYVITAMVSVCKSAILVSDTKTLFDFTKVNDLASWTEVSDTARSVGRSKGALVLQKTKVYQRAVFFAVLNPQPNGACFVGFKTPVDFDAGKYTSVQIRVRNIKGDMKSYKLNFINEETAKTGRSYEHFFDFKTLGEQDTLVTLPLADFQAVYRGNVDPTAPPLDSSRVVELGIQVAGGVYSPIKQSGAGVLEIDSITII